MDGGAPSDGHDPAWSSRERFVSAAVELVLEHHGAGPDLRQVYSYLTPGAVAARSGLSRALIYHHWGGTGGVDAFTAFLGDVTREIWQRAADPDRLLGELPDQAENLSAVVLAVSDIELDLERGPNRPLLQASTTLALAGAIDDREGEDVVDRLSVTYAALGELLGYEPVPPLTYDDIATAVTSVFMGFLLTAEVGAERVARRYTWTPLQPSELDAGGWPMLAIVLESLFDAVVRPAAGSEST
jgi:AcrR family transcriptional regulator